MKTVMAALAIGVSAVALASAVPTVTNVRLSQDANRHKVTITYDLEDADGVVTVVLTTNGVPVAGTHLQGMQGDVATVVAKGKGRTITWKPYKSWPEAGKLECEVAARVTAWPVESPAPYMVVSLDGSKEIRYYETEDALPGGIGADAYRESKMVFRKIPAATACFRLGSVVTETGRDNHDREKIRFVTLTNDYYLAVFPCTQGQWKRVYDAYDWLQTNAKENPSVDSSGYVDDADWFKRPVDRVDGCVLHNTWAGFKTLSDVVKENSFIRLFGILVGLEYKVHLPTEAEWDYACRAGSTGAVYNGYALDDVAWYADNSGGKLHPVGLKKPNAFGLYDMLGNVCERVRDSNDRSDPPVTTEMIAPLFTNAGHGGYQSMCGGAFDGTAAQVRVASRRQGADWQTHQWGYVEDGFGFRLSIPLK